MMKVKTSILNASLKTNNKEIMNKILLIIGLVFLIAIPNQLIAQFDVVAKEGQAPDKTGLSCTCHFYDDFEEENALLRGLAEREREKRLRELEKVFKREIETRLSRTSLPYDNFEAAAKDFFKDRYGRQIAREALNTLDEEYTPNYRDLNQRVRQNYFEFRILNIRRDELGQFPSKLGNLKYKDKYLKDFRQYSEIDAELNEVSETMSDLQFSFYTPHKINSGIDKLRANKRLEDVIAQQYWNNYQSHGFQDRALQMLGYLIADSYVYSPDRPLPVYDPPLYNTDGSGEAYREALEEGDGGYSFDDTDNEAIREYAINSLGDATADYLRNKKELTNEVNNYLERKNYAKAYLDCTYFLFDTYLGGLPFDADPTLYTPYLFNQIQDANNPNLALSFTFTATAISQGMEGFANVLHEFFEEANNSEDYRGRIIRDMFVRNGLSISDDITNASLGELFRFVRTDNTYARINFENNAGLVLLNRGISLIDILSSQSNLELALIIATGNQNTIDFLVENDFSEEAIANTRLAYRSNNNPSPWQSANGKIRNNDLLSYNAVREWIIDGNIINEFRLDNGDHVALGNYLICEGCTESEDRLYYLDKDSNTWFQFAPKPSTYTASDLDFIFDTFWDGAKLVGRYVIPLEDFIVLIDGVNLDGQSANRYFAGAMLVVGVIPGSKLGKAVKPITGIIRAGVESWGVLVKVGDETLTLAYRLAGNTIVFVGGSGKLATLIIKKAGEEAHHIIPWVLRSNDVVQAAARAGFHMSKPLNGKALKKFSSLTPDGIHAKHPQYTEYVQRQIDEFIASKPNYTPQQAADFLEKVLIPDLDRLIELAKGSGLRLNEYFRNLLN